MRIIPLSFLIVWISSLSLFSDEDLATVYRKEGMSPIEKLLDRRLSTTTYWKTELKSHDSIFGYFDNPTDLLICDKSTKKLKLYRVNGHFRLLQKSSIVVGKLPGDKEREGDMRTPIGVYHIVEKIQNPDPIYGPLAFVTDYPNRFDRIRGKNGHGIWLHGFPKNCKDKNATKGCIAVHNDSLVALDKKMDWHKALLIISDKPLKQIDSNRLSRLLAFIFQWRYDWKYNDFHRYISHYSRAMVFKTDKDYNYFVNYKRRVFKRNEKLKKQIRIEDLKVVPQPNSTGKKLWYVSFHEIYKSPTYRYEGPKELIIEEVHPDRFQIVVE